MLYYCKDHKADFLPEQIKLDLEQYKYVFNPSFVLTDRTEYWAFRCYSESRKEILALIYIYDQENSSLTIHDLNTVFKDKYQTKPADPKLFKIKDKVYCTLNTGYSATVQNSVFLLHIGDEIDIKRCVIKKRNTVEKNWAFFEHQGKLKMLYSISPVCKTYTLSSTEDDQMYFEEDRVLKNNLKSISIGTQPIINGDTMYLIGHRKFSVLNKRLYLGVPVRININTLNVETKPVFLVHSLLAMLGNRFKFNRNLISCTYSSGLQIDFTSRRARLSYGVNDISWATMQVDLDDLW